MHELALSRSIVEVAERHAAGRSVTAVELRIGALRQVVPASLSFYFEVVSRDTSCAGSALEYEIVPALLACPECGERWDPAPPPVANHGEETGAPCFEAPSFGCPCCGAGGEVVRGDEFRVESITVTEPRPPDHSEAEEDACIAPR